jgi:hypothetical protein
VAKTADLGTCDAAVPVIMVTGMATVAGGVPVLESVSHEPGWQECGQRATAVHDYECTEGHTKRRATCAEHVPEPGAVGCRACWDAGTERPVTFREVA